MSKGLRIFKIILWGAAFTAFSASIVHAKNNPLIKSIEQVFNTFYQNCDALKKEPPEPRLPATRAAA